jgi:hypothetical protein
MLKHNITRLQHKVLEGIFRRLVVQGHTHRLNIVEVLRLLAQASREEFSEDNDATQHAFLRECFDEALARKNTAASSEYCSARMCDCPCHGE